MIKKVLLVAAAAAVLFISTAGYAESAIVSGWRINYSSEESPGKIMSAGGWRDIGVPSTFRLPYRPGHDIHYAWLRGEFDCTGDPSDWYGISLGRIYYTDRVFINGIPAGGESYQDISVMCRSRNYVIPKGTIRKGVNTVLVQIGIYGNEYGGITSPVTLKRETEFKNGVLLSTIIFLYAPLVFIVTAFVVLLLLVIIYIWNRSERQFLYSSLGVLLYIIYLGSLFYPYRNVDFLFIKYIHSSTVLFFSIALLLVIQSIYGIYITNYNRIMIPVLLLIALVDLMILAFFYDSNAVYANNIVDILGIVTVLFNVPLAVALSLRLNRLKHDLFKFYLSLFIAIGGGLVILGEIIFSIKSGRFSFLLATFCSPAFFLTFSAFFAREIMRKNREIIHLYDKLKEDEPVINESSQEKLEKILEFIRENYTSDLSREGLAAAVDMNPNYMSTLFRKYTGFKINEYINKLRIEEAAGKLAERDAKVIEIAYAVGFESLTTFNRVFKTITGKTPTEYRDTLQNSTH